MWLQASTLGLACKNVEARQLRSGLGSAYRGVFGSDTLIHRMAVFALVLCTLGSLVIVLNYGVVLRFILRNQRGSTVPILGGLVACIGMLVYPGGVMRAWAWVPIVSDPGCLSVLVWAMRWLTRSRDAHHDS